MYYVLERLLHFCTTVYKFARIMYPFTYLLQFEVKELKLNSVELLKMGSFKFPVQTNQAS